MDYQIIGTGSKGNCIILDKQIMLDCGVSYKELEPYLKDIKAIFISHIHKDHLLPSTIKKISFNYPLIKFITGSKPVIAKLSKCGVKNNNILYLKTNRIYDLRLFQCEVIKLVHDTLNYGLKLKYKGQKIIYIIDTANVDGIEAKNYDLYLIEANYKEDVLEQHKKQKDSNFEYDYMYRVKDTHLSYEQAISFLTQNMGNNSRYELLHQSEYNFEEEK